MQVSQGMSSVVVTVGPAHTLRETAEKMAERRTGAAIVFDDDYPGPRIITERDILYSIGKGENPDEERVAQHASENIITAAPDWSMERAAKEMTDRSIRHLVIVENGELSGVLSMRDIVRVWTTDGANVAVTPP